MGMKNIDVSIPTNMYKSEYIAILLLQKVENKQTYTFIICSYFIFKRVVFTMSFYVL